MKKTYVFLLICLFLCGNIKAQTDTLPQRRLPAGGNSHSVSFEVAIPVGVFARSHTGGAGLSYGWSHKRYGRNVFPSRLIGFTFMADGDYYLGKKIRPAGYNFRYDGYFSLHAWAGMIVNPWPHGSIVLAAGPAIGIYEGTSEVGAGAGLFGNYFFKKNFSIGPGIRYKKDTRQDALWEGVVRAAYSF